MTEYEHLLEFAPPVVDYLPEILLVKSADDQHTFTICVDLDGTLAEAQTPFDPDTIGAPRKRAIDYVRRFSDAGAKIIIWTVRGQRKQVQEWLDEHEVAYDHINENPDQPEGASGKLLADAYWDDRGFNAEDPDEHGPRLLQKVIEHLDADKPEESEDSPVAMIINRVTIILAPKLLEAFSE